MKLLMMILGSISVEQNRHLDELTKTENQSTINCQQRLGQSQKFISTKQKMHEICEGLSIDSREYIAKNTTDIIREYLDDEDKLERMLYSEINSYLVALKSSERATFTTNAERLLLYALDDNKELSQDIQKIVIKIYDHVQLNNNQNENIDDRFKNNFAETKEKLRDQIYHVEREFITILGIFASIVVAFVGGITFTTSVLQNIDKAGIFRILLVVDFIGAILLNVMYVLTSFLLRINEKQEKKDVIFIRNANIIIVLIAVIVISCYAICQHWS